MPYVHKKIRGIRKLRRTLNRMEKEDRAVVQDALAKAAYKIKKDAISNVLRHDLILTGKMRDSIDVAFSNDRMTAVIGPGAKHAYVRNNPFDTGSFGKYKYKKAEIKAKEAQFNLMKGWWAEFGTGPPIEQRPKPFMNPAYNKNKDQFTAEIRRKVNQVLKKLALGPD